MYNIGTQGNIMSYSGVFQCMFTIYVDKMCTYIVLHVSQRFQLVLIDRSTYLTKERFCLHNII